MSWFKFWVLTAPLLIDITKLSVNAFFWSGAEENDEISDEYFEARYLSVSPIEKYSMPINWEIDVDNEFNVDKLFQRLSIVDECRAAVADTLLLKNDCQTFSNGNTEEDKKKWLQKFALKITNCHFKAHQRPEIICKYEEDNIERCFKYLEKDYFAIYTQFSLETERICSELNHERWQRSVEELVNELYKNAVKSYNNLDFLKRQSEDLKGMQNTIITESKEIHEDLHEFSNETHSLLSKQSNYLSETIKSSEKTAEMVLAKQEEIAIMQNLSLRSIQDSTSTIGKLIDEKVMTQIGTLGNLSSELNSLLLKNSFTLEQHTGLMSKLTSDVDRTLEKWKPLLEEILALTMNHHLSLQAARGFMHYFLSFIFFYFLTSFAHFDALRLPLLLTIIAVYFLEKLVRANVQLQTFTIFANHPIKTLRYGGYFFQFSIIVLYFGSKLYYYLKRARNPLLTNEQAMALVEELNYLVWENKKRTKQDSRNSEFISLLIDQVSQYRIQANQNKVVFDPIISSKLEKFLLEENTR